MMHGTINIKNLIQVIAVHKKKNRIEGNSINMILLKSIIGYMDGHCGC